MMKKFDDDVLDKSFSFHANIAKKYGVRVEPYAVIGKGKHKREDYETHYSVYVGKKHINTGMVEDELFWYIVGFLNAMELKPMELPTKQHKGRLKKES